MEPEQVLLKKSRWKLILNVLSFLALAILIYTLRSQIHQVIRDFGKVHSLVLFLLIPIEWLNYHVYAKLHQNQFKTLGKKVEYKDMFKLMLELNFVNHILPSGGVSGISYFNVRTKTMSITTAQSTLAQVMKLLILYISFQPILIFGLLVLAIGGHVNNLIMLITSTIVTLVIVGTFVGVYIVESRSRINSFLTFVTKLINRIVHLVRPKHPETISIEGAQKTFIELHENYNIYRKDWSQLKKPFMYLTIANITEVAAVYTVYVAFGHFVNFGAVVIAYAVANFAGLISVLPAGIGIYEGLMTAVLVACGIPASLSIPVTIMYRVLNMSIQLIPGYYFYQKAVHNGLGTPKK